MDLRDVWKLSRLIYLCLLWSHIFWRWYAWSFSARALRGGYWSGGISLYLSTLFSASNPTSVGGTSVGKYFILTLVAWEMLLFLFLFDFPTYVVFLHDLIVFLIHWDVFCCWDLWLVISLFMLFFSDANECTLDYEWQNIDIGVGLLISCCSWVGLNYFCAVDESWGPSYDSDCHWSRTLLDLVTSCTKN